MPVSEGDNMIGKTGPKGYLCWEREPGEMTISSKAENNETLNINVKKGSVTYILQKVQMGILIARTKLELLSKDEGKDKLQKCKPPKAIQ